MDRDTGHSSGEITMSWEDIIKQETIEEYLRNRGYEKVSEKYNGSRLTFKKEQEGQDGEVVITPSYPARGGNYILFNVARRTEIRIIEDPYDMHDAYDYSDSVIEVYYDKEFYQQIYNDFITTDMAEIRDSFNFLGGGKLNMVRLPPREIN